MNRVPPPEGPFVVYGLSELGRDVVTVVEGLVMAGQAPEFLGFVDDNAETWGTKVMGHPVLGGGDWLVEQPAELGVCMGIGAPRVRERIVGRLQEAGRRFVTLVHPTATVGPSVTIGAGSVLLAGVTTTVEVRIGAHVVINPSCSLAHDVVVEDFAYLSPGVHLAGRVRVGTRAYLGTGAVVIPSRTVGADAVLGAGCVVIRDVAPASTVVGVPARALPS